MTMFALFELITAPDLAPYRVPRQQTDGSAGKSCLTQESELAGQTTDDGERENKGDMLVLMWRKFPSKLARLRCTLHKVYVNILPNPGSDVRQSSPRRLSGCVHYLG